MDNGCGGCCGGAQKPKAQKPQHAARVYEISLFIMNIFVFLIFCNFGFSAWFEWLSKKLECQLMALISINLIVIMALIGRYKCQCTVIWTVRQTGDPTINQSINHSTAIVIPIHMRCTSAFFMSFLTLVRTAINNKFATGAIYRKELQVWRLKSGMQDGCWQWHATCTEATHYPQQIEIDIK